MGRLGFTREGSDPGTDDDNSPTVPMQRPSYADIVAQCKRSSDRLIAVVAKAKEKR